MGASLLVLGLLMAVVTSRAFLITKVDPGILVAEPGHTVSLLCAVDDHWEWCRFTSPADTFCDFEWKLSKNNVTMQVCDMATRIEFAGSYDKKECGITIHSLEPRDSGIWTCHLEEYVLFGGRGSGRTAEESISVSVRASTTPPPTVVSTTPLPTTMTTPPSAVSTATPKDYEDFKETVDHEETKLFELPADRVPEPVPQVNKAPLEDDSSAVSTTIGVIIAVIIIVLGALGVMYFRRRRLRQPDRGAAVVFEQEARSVGDQKTIVPGTRIAQVRTGGSQGSPDLHEFFPPVLGGVGGGGGSRQATESYA